MTAFEQVHRIPSVLVAGFALCTFSSPSHAYCVRAGDVMLAWQDTFPDLIIPVYVAWGETSSVANTGHSPEDIARIVLEVIARHNEAVAVPKLRFAGFTDKKFAPGSGAPHADLKGGITIMSFQCEDLTMMNEPDLCDAFSDLGVHACGSMFRPPNSPGLLTKGWVILVPAGCDKIPTPADKWTLTNNPDLAQVLLHELGHTLGLQHSNLSQTECEADSGVHGGNPDGANGVMQSASPSLFPAYRSWRRDDLEGLDHLYHAATGVFELAWWNDDEYPDYPSEDEANSLADMNVSRSAVVSNQQDADWQVLATVGPDRRVLHRVLDAAGNATPSAAAAVVDPGSNGRTWAMPAVAASHGSGISPRVFVAWLANEEPDSIGVDLRVATRSVNDLEWTFENHPEVFRVNRLAASFLPDLEAFVVTTILADTSEIAMAAFDVHGVALGSTMPLDGVTAFDVGTPVCEDSRCLIPYSEPVFGGPNFGIVEVEFDGEDFAPTVIGHEVIPSLDTRGRLALFQGGNELLATIGAGRLALGGWPDIEPDGALFDPHADWPLGFGHWSDGEESPWRMFQPRGVVCGNGIVQAGESCDDMNDIAGDGCHACAVEPDAESDTNSGNGNDEVGDFGGDEMSGEAGCECRATSNPTFPSTLAFLLLLGATASRRRCWASPEPSEFLAIPPPANAASAPLHRIRTRPSAGRTRAGSP